MRIEDITTEKLNDANEKELYSLRLRFIQLWNKNFKDTDKDSVGTLEREDFLAKYKLLITELKSRKLHYSAQSIDEALFAKSMLKHQIGVDVTELESITVVPSFISIVGSFIKDRDKANDLDIVVRQDTRDSSMELLLKRALEKVSKLERHWIYYAKGPHSSYIPLYDLVLRPHVRTEIVEVEKGGSGSGNFGHEGRPGQVGGSSSDGGGDITSEGRYDDLYKWEASLNTEQLNVINSWQRAGYLELRKLDKENDTSERLANLKEALKTAPLYNRDIYRGIRHELDAKMGDTIKLNAISSFSTNPSVAKEFAVRDPLSGKLIPANTPVTLISIKNAGKVGTPRLQYKAIGGTYETEAVVTKDRAFKVVGITKETIKRPISRGKSQEWKVSHVHLEEL